LSPTLVAVIAVLLALLVVGVWCGRARAPVFERAVDATVSLRLTRHDAQGVPGKPIPIQEAQRVRAIVEALGVDAQPATPCPPDYASAEMGILLSGRDVYARRNVYVWGLAADAGGAVHIVVVSSSGCRGGEPKDPDGLRRELLAAP
jgi:hypothetical protein